MLQRTVNDDFADMEFHDVVSLFLVTFTVSCLFNRVLAFIFNDNSYLFDCEYM